MNEFCLRVAVRLVRGWTRLYTAGTPPALRDRRRAEIESDIWESRQQGPAASVPAEMMLRLLLGVHDDLAWRHACRRRSRIAQVAAVTVVAAITLTAGLLFALARAAVLPAPPPLVQRAHVPAPPPPPPPPPPCEPLGSGRTSPTPCQR